MKRPKNSEKEAKKGPNFLKNNVTKLGDILKFLVTKNPSKVSQDGDFWGYFLNKLPFDKFLKYLGYFIFQHLVTLGLQSSNKKSLEITVSKDNGIEESLNVDLQCTYEAHNNAPTSAS